MKKYICDYCEEEMRRPWVTIHFTELSTWHFCWKCAESAERFLASIKEMEERKEEEE